MDEFYFCWCLFFSCFPRYTLLWSTEASVTDAGMSYWPHHFKWFVLTKFVLVLVSVTRNMSPVKFTNATLFGTVSFSLLKEQSTPVYVIKMVDPLFQQDDSRLDNPLLLNTPPVHLPTTPSSKFKHQFILTWKNSQRKKGVPRPTIVQESHPLYHGFSSTPFERIMKRNKFKMIKFY